VRPSSTFGQEFYLVVHGETDAHVHEKICGGGWDIALNAEGLGQARKLARVFQKDKLGIRVIISSPLLRCIQTTDVLHDQLKVKVRVIPGLSERHLGQWEKMDVASVSGFSPLAEQIPGGESLNRFRARVQEAIHLILEIGASNKGTALLVTHGFFGITLLGLLGLGEQKLDRCTLYRFWRESPTSLWKFEEAF
jgi:broad specificity phosphatase PhoE